MALLNLEDTIVALATPPGEGALGIVRLSGGHAMRVADAVWRGKSLSEAATHTIHYGHIVLGEETIDEAVASVFRNPKSYTGEDVVEFSCHGSPYILQRVLQACAAAGARPAQPGEFTKRAFLAGKLDLAQAEAVADLIASGSEAAHRAAMHQLRGGFSAELKALREELIGFAALIELELDFSEEDVEFADRAQLRDLLYRIDAITSRLIESFRLGNAVKEGIAVAIVGKPNAGKSTLLNMLLGEERAIVSDIPGTTRDTIEEVVTLEGVRFRFIDTAGIRNDTDDAIEAQGILRSRQKADAAGLVLYVIDLSDADWQAEQFEAYDWLRNMDKPFLLVHNKYDLYMPLPYPDTGDADEDDWVAVERGAEMPAESLIIDAKRGYGIDGLRRRIVSTMVGSRWQEEGTLVTNARHHTALLRMHEEIEAVQHGLQSGLSGDLLSHHIRQALFHIGTITGEVQMDRDVLGAIFSRFCIGK
jgi:tRNA modification GTPase